MYCYRAIFSEVATQLRKLVVEKIDLSREGSYSVSRSVRPWIKFTLEYPFNYSNIQEWLIVFHLIFVWVTRIIHACCLRE